MISSILFNFLFHHCSCVSHQRLNNIIFSPANNSFFFLFSSSSFWSASCQKTKWKTIIVLQLHLNFHFDFTLKYMPSKKNGKNAANVQSFIPFDWSIFFNSFFVHSLVAFCILDCRLFFSHNVIEVNFILFLLLRIYLCCHTQNCIWNGQEFENCKFGTQMEFFVWDKKRSLKCVWKDVIQLLGYPTFTLPMLLRSLHLWSKTNGWFLLLKVNWTMS